jgi:dihydrofolate synthase/folylpolyglutamate synthase
VDDITTFDQAKDWLHSFVDFERRGFRRHFADVVNLDTIRALLEALGNPQDHFPSLHLAGTKGKGSTAALCEGALRAAGYRTGLYTSPHLLCMRERIRLDGVPVSEERLVALVRQVQPVAEALRDRDDLNPPTFFEIYTALAFLAFVQAGVDVAVVETGLGGRLDATNVLRPVVTAITMVGRDHVDILGDTLPQIAGEKAGILKAGVPVALAAQQPEVEAVIRERAAEVGAPVRPAPRVRAWGRVQPLEPPADGQPLAPPGQTVALQTDQGELRVRLPLPGRHQWDNLAVAWAAIEALGERGFPVSRKQFARGVEGVRWPGRLEIAETRPWLVLDCAHNQPSLRALAAALPATLRYRRLILVYGLSADKEIEAATAEIAPLADAVVLTQAMVHRALWVDQLARVTWSAWRTTPHVTWTVEEALAQARALAGPEDCICVTGSVFVVSAALEALGAEVR